MTKAVDVCERSVASPQLSRFFNMAVLAAEFELRRKHLSKRWVTLWIFFQKEKHSMVCFYVLGSEWRR